MRKIYISKVIVILSVQLLLTLTKCSESDSKSDLNNNSLFNLFNSESTSSGSSQKENSLLCGICKSTSSLLYGAWYYSEWLIVAIGKLGCGFKSGDWDTCTGIIDEMKGPVTNLTLSKLADKDYLCGLVYGYCPTTLKYEDFDGWKQNLLADKPKFVEKKPTKKSSYTVLQFNDIHLDFDYVEDTPADCISLTDCCHKNSKKLQEAEATGGAKAGFWGSPGKMCDQPTRTLDKAIAFIKENIKPDYMFWLGDNTDHMIFESTQERLSNFTKYISDVFIREFPDTPIFPVLGNHELQPVDEYDFSVGKEDHYPYDKVAEFWKKMMDKEAYSEFKKNGYYSTLLDKNRKVRIIGIFVGAYDEMNWYQYLQAYDPGNMFSWLRSQLDYAEKNNEDVFIIKHIPIAQDTNHGANKHMLALLDRYASNIRAVFSGHTHNDHINFIKSQDDTYITTQFIGPSMTTYTVATSSFRVYEIDSDTNVVLDYKQYRLDLDKWNLVKDNNAKVTWDLAYSFLDEYNMKDLSSESWGEFYKKYENDDKELVHKYRMNFQGGKELGRFGGYSKCDIYEPDYERYIECKGGADFVKNMAIQDKLWYKLHEWFGQWIVKKSDDTTTKTNSQNKKVSSDKSN